MAKCALYYIEKQKIEVVNTFCGKEKVLFNGKTISEKPSKLGTAHKFSIGKNEYYITQRDYNSQQKGFFFDIRKNGMPVSLINLWPQTSTQLLILIIVLGLGFGFTLGILFYTLFWPAMGV